MRNTNFLLVATVAVATSIDRSAYDVISRPRHMRQQWGEDNKEEANISFDGSVAAIQALALEKADYLANNQPGFNRGVPTDLSSPITCDGTLTQSLLKVAFEYAVEYDPNYDPSQESRRQLTESDLNEIVQEIEKEMQVRMSNVLLTCKTDDPTVQEAAVVGLVDTPQDKTLTDSKCANIFIVRSKQVQLSHEMNILNDRVLCSFRLQTFVRCKSRENDVLFKRQAEGATGEISRTPEYQRGD